MEEDQLIKKYNVAGPRYTSYPTVPFWDTDSFNQTKWEGAVKNVFKSSTEEISVYIHLPYCESLCTFCGCNTRITVNHDVESSYIDTVLAEWDLYLALMKVKPVIKELHLGGGTPTFFSPENLVKLINGITANTPVAANAEFSFEGHPNNTTNEHLQALYHLGFRRVSFGIQDFDPRVQEVINRIQTVEQVAKVTDAARSIGYTSINYDIVYGLPLQRLEGIKDTIAKVIALKPDRIAFYSYAHIPWMKPGQQKFTTLDLPDDNEKRALYESGRHSFESAGYHEIGMDHFALTTDSLSAAVRNRTLYRNFMGYTSSPASRLIGLGVSSISDIWGAYAQNVKTVEEYKDVVLNQKRIPVFKGHFHTEEDLILRKHILNIMCNFYTSWAEPEEQCEALLTGIKRMTELEKDNLIKADYNSLEVMTKGIPFIRNICMALDARMHTRSEMNTQFSKTV